MELAPSAAGLALMALAAGIIGYSKTALGGLAVIAVAIFATVLPAKESTAAILAILIVGDVIACWHYRHDADWSLIKRLLPAVVPGLVVGALFLRRGRRLDAAPHHRRGAARARAAPAVGEVAQRLRHRLDRARAPGRLVDGGHRRRVRDDDRQRGRRGDDALPVGVRHRQAAVRRHQRVVLPHRQPGEGPVLDRAGPDAPRGCRARGGARAASCCSAGCSATPRCSGSASAASTSPCSRRRRWPPGPFSWSDRRRPAGCAAEGPHLPGTCAVIAVRSAT